MQSEPLSAVNAGQQLLHHEQQDHLSYDFSECTRLKKLTTHDIFKFKHHSTPLIVKLFAPEALPNFQQELSYLSRMTNEHILRILYSRTALNPVSCQPLQKSHLIVMKEATRSDLNDYIPKFGRMNEKMARSYFKQMIEGLSYAASLKPAIIHPNLQASSILLDGNGQLYICGWSQVNSKDQKSSLQQSVFACGQILFCMLTSFMPFYKKNSSTDVFYKFIASQQPHKFWQQIQKKMMKIDKKFVFSPELKKLLQNIFMKKITTFEQVNNEQWVKGQVHIYSQLNKLLEENQKVKLNRIAARQKEEISNEQSRKKVVMEFQLSYGLQRSSPQEEQFLNDYQQNVIKEEQIPQGTCHLKIQASPAFVVACLRSFLREENGKPSVLVGEQFILSNHKVVKVNNYIIIELIFAVSLFEEQEQLMQEDPDDTVALKLKLSFYRNEKQIFAEIEVLQSNFNSYYTTQAMNLVEQKIKKKKQSINQQKVQMH